MSKQRDEKWLDELIAGNIDTSEPKFDAENWKKKYPREFLSLVKGPSHRSSAGRFGVLRVVFSSRAAQVAAAAAIIAALGLFIARLGPGEQGAGPRRQFESPAQMVTAMSFRMAYRRGGMEALEKQCDEAVKLLGPSRPSPSLADLVRDLNG
ncbi:MAG: hypothetical protein ISS79_08995 [Phycisphaerae bacterium]|nr:hypothetical protein [Phycisphaerae bacterium]